MRISDWSSDVCSSDLIDRPTTPIDLGKSRGEIVSFDTKHRVHNVIGGRNPALFGRAFHQPRTQRSGAQRLCRPQIVRDDGFEGNTEDSESQRRKQARTVLSHRTMDKYRSEENTSNSSH